jgi:hypothetical protein
MRSARQTAMSGDTLPVTARNARQMRLDLAANLLALILTTVSIAPAVRAESPPEATRRPAVALSLGGFFFANDDMRRTYGTAPAAGLWFCVNDGPSAQLFLGIQCCSKRGNSYYGDPVFEHSRNARVTVVPVSVGLRTNPRRRHRQGIFVGIAGEYIRTWETVQGVRGWAPRTSDTVRSWGLGGRVLGGL